MSEEWSQTLFLLAAVFFLGWFALGTHWNVRQGNVALKWLQQGLPIIGERTTMRWLGSSVVELKIAKGKEPFRTVDTLVVLEPRDVPFMWAYTRMRGRRDLLIVRAQLHTAPKFEMEAFSPRAWTTHSIQRDVKKKNWSSIPMSSTLQAFHSGGSGIQAKALIDRAAGANAQLVRLSIHRTVPNLEIHYQLPNVTRETARDLFTRVRQIGESVSG
ncbi:MAG: hypothetical protein HY327_07585 [Chloroflexi bacterium]|nr:hypothetical protein [Chloroflexota bacterium]